ncbi:hypothetical protein CRM22_004358 [Opisthorchis felineus]|uniref:Uncharacterized protein n=1 Tax=Opisthorchis felineus TaxID=147828 RepID=A0A4S2LWM1_OPIFE|nr:hypothetical protein CRM22_004358 [Opisthorchis felineus]TGZ68260.1 hypothetical protein CRM22_004358 [Opisthorchis felineus]
MSGYVYIYTPFVVIIVLVISSAAYFVYVQYSTRKLAKRIREQMLSRIIYGSQSAIIVPLTRKSSRGFRSESMRRLLLKSPRAMIEAARVKDVPKVYANVDNSFDVRPVRSSNLGAPPIPEYTNRDGRPRAPSSSRLFDERSTGRHHSRDYMNYAERSRPAGRYDPHTARSNSLYRPTSSQGTASSMNLY